MIYIISIPDKFNLSSEDIKKILDENVVGAWHEPIIVIGVKE